MGGRHIITCKSLSKKKLFFLHLCLKIPPPLYLREGGGAVWHNPPKKFHLVDIFKKTVQCSIGSLQFPSIFVSFFYKNW